jgi:hypothetical protein
MGGRCTGGDEPCSGPVLLPRLSSVGKPLRQRRVRARSLRKGARQTIREGLADQWPAMALMRSMESRMMRVFRS